MKQSPITTINDTTSASSLRHHCGPDRHGRVHPLSLAGLGAPALGPLLAMVTALFVVTAYGEAGATHLLILSRVVLSLQLPFADYPLMRLTGSKEWMGKFAKGPLTAAVAWAMTAGLIGLNGVLLVGNDDIAQRIPRQMLNLG